MATIIKWSLGIDVGSKVLRCCLSTIDESQSVKVKGSRKFSNTASGLQELVAWIGKHYKDHQAGLTITMEATGVYYERCALFLQSRAFRLSVILPTKSKRYLQALGLKSKNDKIDAEGLSRMGAEQKLAEWSAASPLYYELRLLCRQHEDLQHSITAFCNQLHAIEYGMYRFAEIEKSYADAIVNLRGLLAQVEQTIHEVICNNEHLKQKVELLSSIKGVGTLTCATIIAETNGFALFENQKQLISYAGYDVVENQSGNRVGKTRISKKGNSHIRRILHMPALNAVTYKVSPLCNLFDRVYSKTTIKMKGYVAVQKKLLVMLFTLWKKNEAFNESINKTLEEKELEPTL